ncbi:MAG: hypothetical protein AAGF30_10340, partial [Pseudomonadota bacterium]
GGSNRPDTETAVDAGSTDTVMGGRVTTFALGDNVVSVDILDKPDIGNLTVNPDNTLALVLTGTTDDGPLSFSYNVTFADGSTQSVAKTVDVQPLNYQSGWSTGENIYMLETDEHGGLVIEHGDVHRTVHVSNDATALSREDLAKLHKVGKDEVTAEWLMSREEYGSTPDLALNEELGAELWNALTDAPGSHWLLLEKGHDYNFPIIPRDAAGESELHPLYIGSYGEGSAPRLMNEVSQGRADQNIVVEGLEFQERFFFSNGDNLLLNDLAFDGHGVVIQGTSGQDLEGITLRNSTIYDTVKDAPSGSTWGDSDRIQGFFGSDINGLLIEGVHIDHTGWEEGYSPDWDASYGQTPSKMSQNVYLQYDNSDVTFRDNISMRAASFGVQVRPGGFIEDNVFIDNNAATNAVGGNEVSDGVKDGHFSMLSGNLVTSGGAKETTQNAALTWALNSSPEATRLDNIVAHLADPNNPQEFQTKVGNGGATSDRNAYYDNTVVYNWMAQNFRNGSLDRNLDKNVDNLDTQLADQTTIQNFTAALLGQSTATIDDLGQYLRGQVADGEIDDVTADDILAYFRETFDPNWSGERSAAETLRFIPSDLGDGVRWDNRVNWSTEDLPGTAAGDSIDLGGNWVVFASVTADLQDFAFGSDGRLNVTSGKLEISGETTVGADGAEVDISGAGQFWMNGYTGAAELDIDVNGGRFANTGELTGQVDLSATGGQTILATSGANLSLDDDSRVSVVGSDAKVGFDGDDGAVATLQLEGGRLDFVADENGFSEIGEFRSGHFDDEPNVLSGIDMGDGVLGIDITGLNGAELRDTLLGADEILGNFSTIELIGLADNQDATITFDYEEDEVSFYVTKVGDGEGKVQTEFLGDMMDADESAAIWDVLTEGQGTYSDTDLPDIEINPEDPNLFSAAA